MNINATIIVQAFNIFITFWIVRLLLIKPVMKALSSDQEAIDALEKSVKNAEYTIAHLKKEQEYIWANARTTFYAQLPQERTVSDSIFKDIAPSIDAVTFSEQDQSSFIDQSVEKIVTRLG